jgi:hypothetical protein
VIQFSSEPRFAAPTKETSSVGRPVKEMSEPGVPSSDQNFLYRMILRGGVGVRSRLGGFSGTLFGVGETDGEETAGVAFRDEREKASETRSLLRSACRLAA